MYRARLDRDIEFSKQLERVVPALQDLPERRFTPTTDVLVDRLKSFDGARKWTGLDDTY